MNVHIALNTDKLDESIDFYRAFFGTEPVKRKPGYAKFSVAEPALNFTLNEGAVEGPGALNHLGVEVASTEAVKAAAERLRNAGLATFEEADTDCCYALQDKVWVHDPNGYAWEVFVVKVGDTRPELQAENGSDERVAPCCDPAECAA